MTPREAGSQSALLRLQGLFDRGLNLRFCFHSIYGFTLTSLPDPPYPVLIPRVHWMDVCTSSWHSCRNKVSSSAPPRCGDLSWPRHRVSRIEGLLEACQAHTAARAAFSSNVLRLKMESA